MKNHFKHIVMLVLVVGLWLSCTDRKDQRVVTPWGEVMTDSIPADSCFTMSDIVSNGELIALTMSGPATYYDYHGRGMGTQYLLCERFAQKMGVSVRVELCRDTMEMVKRLLDGEGDIIVFPLPKNLNTPQPVIYCGAGVDSLKVQWAVAASNKVLADSLNAWYKPAMLAEVNMEQRQLFRGGAVKRHVYSPFLNKAGGVISHYDPLFKKYAPVARWDWRLLAAQCYQESCFDPNARSWAGACGLMQIMPATAQYLGLPMSEIFNPEPNIRAAANYLLELNGKFRDIPDMQERQCFILASYNGGFFHIRDAMALARKNGKNPHRWRDVAPFVLALEQPACYNDPVVKYGYMRGSETVGYVDNIRQRYAQYRGVPYGGGSVSPNTPHRATKKHRFHI